MIYICAFKIAGSFNCSTINPNYYPSIMAEKKVTHGHELSAAGALITLGIIFGDIGTSPIYVMNAIMHKHIISKELVYGGLSCVFWTLMIDHHLQVCLLSIKCGQPW
jgi:K+ transporter